MAILGEFEYKYMAEEDVKYYKNLEKNYDYERCKIDIILNGNKIPPWESFHNKKERRQQAGIYNCYADAYNKMIKNGLI